MKKPLIILTGPTAVGKTAASIGLAKAIGGEIISADSMQVYRHMDIGSAKIRSKEMQGISHHLIDVLEPEEEFHVVKFQQMAKEALDGIYQRGHIPIVVGGTGFYIQALLYDISFEDNEEDHSYRKELEELAQEEGAEKLHQMLRQVDEKAALEIHANNVKRVIRALEFYHQTGEKISEHNAKEREKESAYNSAYFVLNDDRANLYERINKRVDAMFEEGLVEEVTALQERGYTRGMVSMQGAGIQRDFCLSGRGMYAGRGKKKLSKRDTRHFAKRQITWFKRERDVIWINKQEYGYQEEKILERILKELKVREIFPQKEEEIK